MRAENPKAATGLLDSTEIFGELLRSRPARHAPFTGLNCRVQHRFAQLSAQTIAERRPLARMGKPRVGEPFIHLPQGPLAQRVDLCQAIGKMRVWGLRELVQPQRRVAQDHVDKRPHVVADAGECPGAHLRNDPAAWRVIHRSRRPYHANE